MLEILSEDPCLYWSFVILLIVLLFYIIGTWTFSVYKDLGIPTASFCLPYLGHFVSTMYHGLADYDTILIKKHGKNVGTYFGAYPILVTTDLELLRQVFIKDNHIFNYRQNFGLDNPVMDHSVTELHGDDWKRVRTLLTPAFTTGKLKNMLPLISQSVDTFEKRFLDAAETNEEVDVKKFTGGLSMEVTAKTMFGMDIGCQGEDDIFTKEASRFFQISAGNPFIMVLMLFPRSKNIINYLFPNVMWNAKSIQFFVNTVENSIKARKDSNQTFHDFLALMLNAEKDVADLETSGTAKKTIQGLSNLEILAQALIFMIAGYDTTANGLNRCLYFLAKNQSIQDKCRAEIMREIGEGTIGYDEVAKLTYIDQCLQETLRLVPAATRLDRVANQEATLTLENGRQIKVKPGLTISAAIMTLHKDPYYWDEPEEFRPERFSPEEKDKRDPLCYLPFGTGPRNCIGMRFAMLEMKIALARVLRAVRVIPCDKTPEKLELTKFGDQLVKPIYLKVEKMNK